MEVRKRKRRLPTMPVTPSDIDRDARDKIRLGYERMPFAVDGRGSLAKRFKEIAGQLMVDQGKDLPAVRLQLVKRFVGCCVLCETIEGQVAAGETVGVSEYSALINSLVRLANRIGLDRIPKNVTPSLDDYLRVEAAE